MILAPRDLIIVKVCYKNTIAKGVIVIPDLTAAKSNIMEYHGEVTAIGPKSPFRNDLKVGDKILYHRNEGIKVILEDGTEFSSLKPRAILGVYDETN